MNTLNKRQIIILSAFCLPLFALIFVSYVKSEETPVPTIRNHLLGQRPKPQRPVESIETERARIKARIQQVERMTPEQFEAFRNTDPRAGATKDLLRARLLQRLSELERMTPAQFATEQLVREEQARQNGSGIKPGATPQGQQPVPQAPVVAPTAAPVVAATTPAVNTPPVNTNVTIPVQDRPVIRYIGQ